MNNSYDVVIIGAGPAGLSAGLYCARAGLKVVILEKNYPGGKLNKTLSIENYPGYTDINGPQLGENMLKQIEEMKVELLISEVVDIKNLNPKWLVIDKKGKEYIGKTILITSGMKERVLDIPNVNEYYGKGVSYCAICDGNLYTNKKVTVVGGGNSAVEESLYLSNITEKVNLVHRRRKYRAENIFVTRMKSNNKITEHLPYIPLEVTVENDKVVGLTVENVETKEKKLLNSECVFFYVGLIPENYFIKNLNLEKDENGFVKTNSQMETSIPGIFAAGDITHKELRQVVTAASDGAVAAISIKNYLDNF